MVWISLLCNQLRDAGLRIHEASRFSSTTIGLARAILYNKIQGLLCIWGTYCIINREITKYTEHLYDSGQPYIIMRRWPLHERGVVV